MLSNSLQIGAGLSKGVLAFLSSFNQAKMYEHQTNLEKNDRIARLLTSQLEDENIPYSRKADIVDEIGNLYKTPNLSKQFHMDKFNDMMVGDPNKPAQKGKEDILPINPSRIDTATGNPDLTQGAGTAGQIGTPDIPEGQIKQGDLTPAQIKLGLQRKQKEFADKQDFDKEAKVLKLNYTLQKQILGKGGYTKELPSTFDADGNYTIRFMNADGDIITRNLGKVTPEAVKKAQIAADKPAGKLGQLQTAQSVVSEYEANNTSHTHADYTAAKKFLQEFEQHGDLQKAMTTAYGQNIYGTPPKPITPQQDVADKRQAQENARQAQKDIDEATSADDAARAKFESLATEKDQAGKAAQAADKYFKSIAAEFGGDYSASSPEYTKAKQDANNKLEAFNKLERAYQDAKAIYTKTQTDKAGAVKRKQSFSANPSDNNIPDASSPIGQQKIKQFMKDNPKVTDPNTAAQILRNAGRIK